VRGWTFHGVRVWLPLYVLLTIAIGFVDLRLRRYPDHGMQKYVAEVVTGAAEAPGLYRVLMPFLLVELVDVTGIEPMTVWHMSRLAGLFASWLALHAYLRNWFTVGESIAGTTIVAAALPLLFTNSWAHPDQLPELALFSLGCLAVVREWNVLFGITLALAAFNRETAVFLVPLYLVGGPLTRMRVAKTVAFGGIWAAIYVGLRLGRGMQHYEYWQFWRNIEFLQLLPATYDPYYRAYAWFPVALFGPLLYVALQSRAGQPLFVRRALWIVPPFAATCLLFSSIVESRIFTPLLPLVLPGVMFTLFPAEKLSVDPGPHLEVVDD
jgi:hypothetical protein